MNDKGASQSDPQHRDADAQDLLGMSLPARTRRLLDLYDLRPRKSLSQNFLVDAAAADALAQAVGQHCGPDAMVVEIGAGLGALTVPLAELGRAVAAFETDPRLIPPLQLLTAQFPNVRIIHADITEQDLAGFAAGRQLAAVGNLPYHLTGLLLRALMEVGYCCDVIVVTVQAEVADRVTAAPGEEQYGMLSVFAHYYLELIETPRRLGPSAFVPRPDVDSVALILHPLPNPAENAGGLNRRQEQALFSTIKAAFAHRRKTLRNSLAASAHLDMAKDGLDGALAAAGIDGGRRGEELGIEDFVRLALAVDEAQQGRA